MSDTGERPRTPEAQSEAPQPAPARRRRLTRDQRVQVLALRQAGLLYTQIASQLGISLRAVSYTCSHSQPTPQHRRAGRPALLSEEQVDELVSFVTGSKEGRRMRYYELAEHVFHGEVGPEPVRYALHKRGFRRCVASSKPPLSDDSKAARLLFAEQHVDWTPQDWSRLLWSDETWVTAGNHRKTYVTRRPSEELDPTCILERIRRKRGWMFWGSFYGYTKGPGLVWKRREWGTINKTSYCERIVPLVADFIDETWREKGINLQFMQDNAPAHKAAVTKRLLTQMGVRYILWPAYSPDLNPIETVWDKMKDWLAEHYPEQVVPQSELYDHVLEAWEAIGSDLFQKQLDSMPQRCRDVIAANGGHTKW